MNIFRGNLQDLAISIIFQVPPYYVKDILEISFPVPPTMSSNVGY